MSVELDTLIREKRSQLKDAFAVHQKAREAVVRAHRDLPGDASERLTDARAETQHLEIAQREAATRLNTISGELAELHRAKYGEWHFTWRGPRPSR